MRRFPPLILLLLVTFASAHAQAPPDPKKAHVHLSEALMKDNNPDEALRLVNEAISADPEFAAAYYWRAQMRELKGERTQRPAEYEKADKDYLRAVVLSYVSQGRLLAKTDPKLAFSSLQQAATLANGLPRNDETGPDRVAPLAFFHLGLAYAQQAEYDQAISNYTRAIDRFSGYSDAYYNRGLAHSLKDTKDNLDLAIADARRAIELRNNFTDAYQSLGIFYQQAKRWKDAEELYRTAFKHTPDDPDLIHALGSVYLAQENYKEALVQFKKASEMKPKDAEYLSDLGWTVFNLGEDKAKARDHLERARAMDDSIAATHERLGDVYAATGQNGEAIKSYLQALKLLEESEREQKSLLHEKLGMAYAALNNKSAARASFEDARNLADPADQRRRDELDDRMRELDGPGPGDRPRRRAGRP
jgi:tetratricopeptide (TPR) repeat protein